MRRTAWAVAATVAVVAATVTGGVVAAADGDGHASHAQEPATGTGTVKRGALSNSVSLDGTLTHRAREDGSPYAAINQARGIYTMLPQNGDRIGCGEVLYRVDGKPVLLLCGSVPMYRGLSLGAVGHDVGQLNRNLHRLGYDVAAGVRIHPGERTFTATTELALEALQRHLEVDATGELAIDAAVFLPEAVRIAKVAGELGGAARPDQPVVQATSDLLEVQVTLDPSQQSEVMLGDRAEIALPGNRSVTGRVDGIGRVAVTPAGQDGGVADATIPAHIRLDQPQLARGLDQAPVQVEITTTGVEDAMSVPVTAIVGRSGGGYAVEVVRDGGRRQLVTVRLGLFDTTAGRVQVDGDLRAGDHVVVPSP